MRYRILLAAAACTAATDALTKTIAAASSRQMPVHLPDGWTLQVAHNHGVIGGGGGGTATPGIFAAIALVWITALLILSRRRCGPLGATGLGLIIGGAVANLGELHVFGYVVDWIRPPHLPFTFDLADVAVVLGQVLLLASLLGFWFTGNARGAVA